MLYYEESQLLEIQIIKYEGKEIVTHLCFIGIMKKKDEGGAFTRGRVPPMERNLFYLIFLYNYKEGKGRPYTVSLSSGNGDVGWKKGIILEFIILPNILIS